MDMYHTELQRLCVSMCRGSRIILRVPILILFCCVRHLSTAVTIFAQPEVSFRSLFIEIAINLGNTFFPLNSDASWNIYDLNPDQFCAEVHKDKETKMNRHWQAGVQSPSPNPKWCPVLMMGLGHNPASNSKSNDPNSWACPNWLQVWFSLFSISISTWPSISYYGQFVLLSWHFTNIVILTLSNTEIKYM